MASRSPDPSSRQLACDGKHRFDSPKIAEKAMRKRGLMVYKCPHCRGYHVGNNNEKGK